MRILRDIYLDVTSSESIPTQKTSFKLSRCDGHAIICYSLGLKNQNKRARKKLKDQKRQLSEPLVADETNTSSSIKQCNSPVASRW